jgi:two-component system sensor histidine kinase YesM
MKNWVFMPRRKLERIIESRIEETMEQARRQYRHDILMKQANIATLQGQINPHFLYNALECIRGQALMEGAEEIASITQALSRFYRYSIDSKSDVVTLKEELDNVMNYMTIQRYRFKDRFTIYLKYDDEEVLNATVPKLTLQPLVENAIMHGFADVTSNARITITIRGDKNQIQVLISDNGQGMHANALRELNNRIARAYDDAEENKAGEGKGERRSGIAIENVNDRIRLLFGDEYGLTVFSCAGMGTDVEIFLPYQQDL